MTEGLRILSPGAVALVQADEATTDRWLRRLARVRRLLSAGPVVAPTPAAGAS